MSKKTRASNGFVYYKDGAAVERFSLSRDNLRKLDPKVFEKAAEFIDTEHERFSCIAVAHAATDLHPYMRYRERWAYEDAWVEAFGPYTKSSSLAPAKGHPFWNVGLNGYSTITNEVKQARLTSLAMMASIVRAARK